MSEPESYPEPHVYQTDRFRYGAFIFLTVLWLLVYGGMRLYWGVASTTDPTPKPADTPNVVVPSPPPRCSFGVGSCDWAGLQSPRPRCYHGVGTCDWARLKAVPSGCQHGVGKCDWVRARAPTQSSDDGCRASSLHARCRDSSNDFCGSRNPAC